MKKIISVLLCVILIFSLSINSLATENIDNECVVVEYLEDGSCFITAITMIEENSTYATNTKTFAKTTSY